MFLLLFACLCNANELYHLGLKNYSMVKKENEPIAVLLFSEDRVSKRFLPEFLEIAK
jgi:hypothetical protein